jgi:hypothetical protein
MANLTPKDLQDVSDHARALHLRELGKKKFEEERRGKPPELIGFSLEELLLHKFPLRKPLLLRGDDVLLRAGHLWQIFAYRGFGKTWLLETLALICAYSIKALDLHAPEPSKVLYIDGEMASEDIKERFALLCDMLKVPRQLGLLAKSNLTIVGSDWQDEYLPNLDTPEGQAAVEPLVEEAEIVLIDGRSSLFDPEGEKDPTAWAPAQHWLLSLRKRGKAVIWTHQANRQGGSRGHGKAEDPINVNIKLSRPEDYTADQGARFLVEFDKARGIRGEAALPFTATLGSRGWVVESSADGGLAFKLREYLKLAKRLGESPTTASRAVSGAKVGRTNGLKQLAEWIDNGVVVVDDGKLVWAEK